MSGRKGKERRERGERRGKRGRNKGEERQGGHKGRKSQENCKAIHHAVGWVGDVILLNYICPPSFCDWYEAPGGNW